MRTMKHCHISARSWVGCVIGFDQKTRKTIEKSVHIYPAFSWDVAHKRAEFYSYERYFTLLCSILESWMASELYFVLKLCLVNHVLKLIYLSNHRKHKHRGSNCTFVASKLKKLEDNRWLEILPIQLSRILHN